MGEHHWTPQQIAALTLGQLMTLWDPDTKPKELSKAEQLELLNQKRARKGLPPLEPRKADGH